MQKLTIILAGGADDKGGIERVTDYTHRELLRLAPDLPIDIHYSRTGSGGIGVHLSALPSLFKLARKLSSRRGQVVHVNVAPRGSTFRKAAFLYLAKAMGARTVLQLHGSGYNEFYPRQAVTVQSAIRRLFHAADLVVVLGEFWRGFVVDELGVAPAKVIEVSNGVPDPGRSATPEIMPVRIVFAGAVGERKGTDVLLHALARLRDDGAAFHCDILGDGEVDRYVAMARDLRLQGAVTFHGWQDMDAVRAAMAGASLFVLPSRAENQPVAILEAMAIGLPVVASRIGAIPEQIEHGVTGLLVEPGDASSLHNALGSLTRSPTMRAAFGEAGRKRWRALFSIESNARLLLDAYRSLRAS